jgi:nucleotide-binding universal stress UspA family protein
MRVAHDVIVAASDLSETSEKVVGFAGELATALGARLIGIHVLTDVHLRELQETLPTESSYIDVIVARLQQELEEQLARAGGAVDTTAEVVIGEEAANLLAFAEDKEADLLVIGIRNRSRIGKLVTGSVTQEVLLSSACPVVAVPTG